MENNEQDSIATSEREVQLAEELNSVKAQLEATNAKLLESNNKLLEALTQPKEKVEVKVPNNPKPFELKDIKF